MKLNLELNNDDKVWALVLALNVAIEHEKEIREHCESHNLIFDSRRLKTLREILGDVSKKIDDEL